MMKFAWLFLFMGFNTHAFCFISAGHRYHIDPLLLQAMTVQESGMNPGAINNNRDKHGHITSTDYGAMQINSSHIPDLLQLGIIHDKRELLTNPCLNVQIGAWLLAQIFQTCGVNWECLGAYNAGMGKDNPRRMVYARLIYARYRRLKGF